MSYYGKDYEDEVAKKIKEAGYNPDDYELIYKRYAKWWEINMRRRDE